MDQPKDKVNTGIFVFAGAAIGAILGIIAYVNDWLG